jgi:hypothetical protein
MLRYSWPRRAGTLGRDASHHLWRLMQQFTFLRAAAVLLVTALSPVAIHGQSMGGMDHSSHAAAMRGAAASMPAGQDAYATVAAVVAALEADSTTDWSRVNIEALRQHLLVMNDVTLGARATQSPVNAGARMDVTGDGRVAQSIRAMLHAHAPELEAMGTYRATVEDIPSGARLTVTASDARDTTTVAKIRALGFMGLLTLGNHHAQHHMALARGTAMTHR